MSQDLLKKSKTKGQVLVEYVIFVTMLVSIIIFLFGKIKRFILGDESECTPQNKALVCRVEQTITFGQGSTVKLGERYRYFSL